jgi:two-component system chemotaxis sensor kinase CheA
MNTAELLDQFISEARECLEQIGKRLLDVERSPGDAGLLNDLFRQVHTLKGNCGLFEFKALERIVHAGEDLLDRVRSGELAYGAAMADALLDAMDYTGELIDEIAAHGAMPAAADARSQQLAAALRQHLHAAPKPGAASDSDATAPVAAQHPDWVDELPAEVCVPGHQALRYVPESECFFKGEDPWALARNAPGLQHLAVVTQGPWGEGPAFDCYRCNLVLLIASDAPRAELDAHFRYVPEQVEIVEIAPRALVTAADPAAAEGPAPAHGHSPEQMLLSARIARLWDGQRAMLARQGPDVGTVAAVRSTLARLLACALPPESAQAAAQTLAELPLGAAALAAWARQHHPAGAPVEAADAAGHEAASAASNASASQAAGAARSTPLRSSASPAVDDAASASAGPAGQRVLKVGQDKIDRLMDLIGEMVVAKNSLPYLAQRAEEHYKQRDLAREIKTQYAVINRIAEDMQHAIMQVRMLPVGTIFQRFGRLVRDISRKLGKDVALVIEGEDTEADKNVIEALADPLIHILRNSLDHGIEVPAVRVAAGKPAQGTLRVTARQEADRVLLDIVDDGAGIDVDRVRAKAVERGLVPATRAAALSDAEAAQLVFLPGFSTADAISDLSGRGVGMDVVRTAVERVNGSVELSSVRGQGTTLRLTLPLSMAVTNVMMIDSGGCRFGVPMDLIVETVRVNADDIHHFKQAMTTVLRGRVVPLQPLNGLLALSASARRNADNEHAVLVVRHGAENVGLLVDDFHGTSDIILKPLEGVLAGITGFAGTALMGDGSVLMVLNPKELL